jgi:hypothetical protein
MGLHGHGTTTAAHAWANNGIPLVKIKIGEARGTRPDRDMSRVALARRVVGDNVELYVDANGGYTRKQAIRLGQRMTDDYGVTWFEEPVSSDDLNGLGEVRDRCDADTAAGEYGYTLEYFHDHTRIEHMLFDGRLTPTGGAATCQLNATRSWAQNASRSAGLRLVTSVQPEAGQTFTSWSTQWPPALRMSV